jgi:hypothetical protein
MRDTVLPSPARQARPAPPFSNCGAKRQAPARVRREFAEVFAIVEEGQVAGAGGVERRNVADCAGPSGVSARGMARVRLHDVADRQFTAWSVKKSGTALPLPSPTCAGEWRGTTTIAYQNRAPPPNWNHCKRS